MFPGRNQTFGRAALAAPRQLPSACGKRCAAKCQNGVVALVCAMVLTFGAGSLHAQDGYQYPSKVNVSWNRLNNYDEVTQIIKDLAAAYPDLLTLQSIGKSYQNRDMWEMTLNAARTGKDTDKPVFRP